jgi:hypothetical protein
MIQFVSRISECLSLDKMKFQECKIELNHFFSPNYKK